MIISSRFKRQEIKPSNKKSNKKLVPVLGRVSEPADDRRGRRNMTLLVNIILPKTFSKWVHDTMIKD